MGFHFQISQKRGTQDISVLFTKNQQEDADFEKVEVVYVDRFDKVLPKLDTASLNPSFENSTTCTASTGLTKSTVLIKNVASGGKTFYLSVTDCNGVVVTYQANYTVRPWWWDSIASLFVMILLIIGYFLLVGFGLWGAIRVQYRISREGVGRSVVSWLGFALGFLMPTLQGIPIAIGFTNPPSSGGPTATIQGP
ncbi:MAG: hypothetical protein CMO44_12810 [Verrucomicrobiales bacterium]|nr:hypothetical protein [Verrucomicrobiales bacterium]|tara:strand:+ start:3901 stop:4485 length:585 start_codon:yes stop_codon:yes gene_type:complete